MSKEYEQSVISKQIYDLCQHYHQYKLFIKNKRQENQTYKGYLINFELIKNFEKNILYEDFQIYLNEEFEKVKNSFEQKCKDIKIEKNIIQTKFDNIQDLIKSLDEKKFIFINDILWKEICKDEIKEEENGITFLLQNDKVTLILKDNTKLDFQMINDDCIIEKSRLIKNIELNELSIGDTFIFKNTGAYSSTEGIALFLSRELPKVVLVKDNHDILVRNNNKTSVINCPNYEEE